MQRENPPLPEISVWLLLFQLNLEQSHLHEIFSSPLNIFIPKPQKKRNRKTVSNEDSINPLQLLKATGHWGIFFRFKKEQVFTRTQGKHSS